MTPALLPALAGASVVLAALAAVAAAVTRRTPPASAAAAHRVWLTVVGLGIPLVVLELVAAPIVVVSSPIGGWPAPLAGASSMLPSMPALMLPLMAAGYLAVTAVLIARVVVGIARVRRLVAASACVPGAEIACRAPGVVDAAAGLDLRETAALSVPVTVGILRPIVLLPRAWQRWSDRGLEAILRHERAHVVRRDYLWTLVAAATESCLWFHPAIWLGARRLRWFAEVASDRVAAESLGAETYAAELLQLATRWVRGNRIRYAVTVGAESSLPGRVRALLEQAGGGVLGARGLRRLALVMALAAIAAAGVRVTASSTPGAADDLFDHAGTHRARHQARHH